jgi:hypothetical protein
MTGNITYQATRAHIDDLRRQAAKQRLATGVRLRTDASLPQITEQRQRSLRRVLRGLDPRPASR